MPKGKVDHLLKINQDQMRDLCRELQVRVMNSFTYQQNAQLGQKPPS